MPVSRWVQAAPALRLSIAPVLALAVELAAGTPLPFLGPVFVVILLMLSPMRPPLLMLARLFAIVAGTAFVIVWLGVAVKDSPLSLWLGLVALFTYCFARLAQKPQDLSALVAMIVGVLTAVLMQISAELPPVLPWLMMRAFLFGIAVILIAHAILPGSPAAIAPPPAAAKTGYSEGLRALAKSLALIAVLVFCILLRDTSAILIAVTVTNVLRLPDRSAGMSFGWRAVHGNLFAVIAATPTLMLLTLHPDQAVTALILALAGTLTVTSGIGRSKQGTTLAQTAMPVFVTLLGLYAPIAGEGILMKIADRLFALILAITFGVAVHSLLSRPLTTEKNQHAA